MDKKIPTVILRRQRLLRILLWCGVVTAALVVVMWLLGFMEKSVQESELRFGTVDSGSLVTMVNASGTVRPAYEEIINSPVDSRIVKVYVREGDSVSAGTPLLQLDLATAQTEYEKMANDYQVKQQQLRQLRMTNNTQLSELQMQIKVKEMEVSRMTIEAANERRLDSLGSGTGERVRQAETALATARLELAQLNQRLANERQTTAAAEEVQELGLANFRKDMEIAGRTLDQGRIPAPYSGVVSFINNKVGSRVTPGEKVAVVSDLSSFYINGQVPEGYSQRISNGQQVEVRAGQNVLPGMVSNVTANSQGGAVALDVTLDNPADRCLRSGMHVDLYISCGYKDNVVRLPAGPFFKGAGEYYLFVEKDGVLTRRKVNLGDSNRDYIEVLSGLEPGERAVVSDMSRYSSNEKLKIKK